MRFQVLCFAFCIGLLTVSCTQKPKVPVTVPVVVPKAEVKAAQSFDSSYLKLQFDATSAIRQTTQRPKVKALSLHPVSKGSKEFATALEGVRQFILKDIRDVTVGQRPITKTIDVNKIYKVSDHCNGHSLYAFSDADLVPVKLVMRKQDDDEIYMGNFGSAGYSVRVFSVIQGKVKVYLDEVLLDVLGSTAKTGCPRIVVQLHGSVFGDVGYESGVAVFEFTKSRYHLIKDQYGDEKEVREYDLDL